MAVARTHELNVDWRQLYELHAPELRKTIRARVPSNAVEDVLQETFLALYRAAHRVDFSRRVGPLVRTIATRQCVQWWRRNRPTEHADTATETSNTVFFVGCDDHVSALAASEAVTAGFSAISTRHRRLLYRSAFRGERADQLALIEGCSEKAVRSALDRARATLRRQLEPTSLIGGWAYRARRRFLHFGPLDRAMVGERVAAALAATAAGVVVVSLAASPASSTRLGLDSALTASSGRQDSSQGRLQMTPEPERSTPSERPARLAPPEQPADPRPPISVDHGVAVTHGPESSAFDLRLDVRDPIGGRTHSAGKSVACNSGRVGAAACAVAPLVPGR